MTGGAQPQKGVQLIEWKPLRRNALYGFTTVQFPSGAVFHSTPIMRSHGKLWANPAGIPATNRDGSPLIGPKGKRVYTPVVSFASKEARDRWSAAVVAAVQAAHPDDLTDKSTVDDDLADVFTRPETNTAAGFADRRRDTRS